MIPAIRWSPGIRWSPAIRWSPGIRWSIRSMDFENWKVYGDTFISDGLVFTFFQLENVFLRALKYLEDGQPCSYLKLLPCPALPQFDSWGWWWCWLLFFVSPFLSEIGAIISQESPDTVVALKAFFGENELSLSICQVHLEDKLSDHADFSASIKDYEYIQIDVSELCNCK